jgi:hypothetical protein
MIPTQFQMMDTRIPMDFRNRSFSGYSIANVATALKKELNNGDIEKAALLSIELLVSGYCEKAYHCFLNCFCKNIYTNNPQLPYTLYLRYSFMLTMRNHLMTGDKMKEAELQLRNEQTIRNHITELTTLICNSKKDKSLSNPSIKPTELNTHKSKAPHSNFSKPYLLEGDTAELEFAMNEFIYAIQVNDFKASYYWISWMSTIEKLYNSKKEGEYRCAYRKISNVQEKYHYDFIWIFWQFIVNKAISMDKIVSLQIQSLLKIYKYNFTPASKTKKMPLILAAVRYFTDIYSIHTNLINSYSLLVQTTARVNLLFIDLKKHEIHTPRDTHETKPKHKQKTKSQIVAELRMNHVNELDRKRLLSFSKK